MAASLKPVLPLLPPHFGEQSYTAVPYILFYSHQPVIIPCSSFCTILISFVSFIMARHVQASLCRRATLKSCII